MFLHNCFLTGTFQKKDMGTVIKVSGSNALHRSFLLGSLILANVGSYPRLSSIHRHTAHLKTGVSLLK